MSLAEELLADLEDYDADDDVDQGNEANQNNERIDEIEEITEMEIDGSNYDKVTKVARLRDSENFKRILEKVNEGTFSKQAYATNNLSSFERCFRKMRNCCILRCLGTAALFYERTTHS